MLHKLPQLKYSYEALERSFDAKTMEIHYSKHHQAYIDNLNKALEGFEDLSVLPVEALIKNINSLPDQIKNVVRNNAGGHWNHSFFWESLSEKEDDANKYHNLINVLNKSFGSFENFKDEFKKIALSRFGSGWVWLIKDKLGNLKIVSTPNQDNPLMDIAEVHGTPILALDVWEHAYYLRYQNKRADYVDAFWSVVDWGRVDELIG